MAHHLAELITTADDEIVTPELRLEICGLILEMWGRRRDGKPEPEQPLNTYGNVIRALDRLSNDVMFHFFGWNDDAAPKPTPEDAARFDLVRTSVELEGVMQDAIIRLLWLAVREHEDEDLPWFELTKNLAEGLEQRVYSSLSRLNRRIAHRQLLARQDQRNDLNDEPGAEGATLEDLETYDQPEPGEPDPFSDEEHANHLRKVAATLVAIADQLAPHT